MLHRKNIMPAVKRCVCVNMSVCFLFCLSAMDGVPFIISEKFACASSDLQQADLMGITIKTLAEIEKEYEYSFRTEYSAAARLPPSPTRTQLSSEA
ncbi:hypothetical protein SKAU_G00277820 [Synaphobranchus kaupii]|uniref:UMA domain-containing protein n=1 Tax=Synaphobranchus kaupii TaxID=118154 RepID=A0A9Q1EWI4_SYNKA|nr:hypothetical protein SKAU_G00277820 [Synaphobranchus kaupii]